MTKKHNNNKEGGFANFKICDELLKGISRKGYTYPTPIQNKTIPLIISGRDVVAMAQTGSGKTASFLIPMFEKLKNPFCGESRIGGSVGPRALIISPTRELALQTVRFASELGHFMSVKVAVLLGGERMDEDFRALHENPDIIIATPARLLHIQVEMGSKLNLSNVDFVVFDEGDRLFELGMVEQLTETFNRLPRSRQTVIFSATLPSNLIQFSRASLDNPVLVRLDVNHRLSDKLKLNMIHCPNDQKMSVLIELLYTLIRNKGEQAIVFFVSKHHVEYVSKVLDRFKSPGTEDGGFNHVPMYSSMDPEARKQNADGFRKGIFRVMLTTDIAARGIDIPALDNVINFHFPDKPKLFQHRVGRVARAGAHGNAFSLIDNTELPYVIDTFMYLSKPFKMIDEKDLDLDCVQANGYLGNVPSSVLNEHEELLKLALIDDSETKSYFDRSTLALGKYNRTRILASSESVKKSRLFIDSMESMLHHPLFAYANQVSDIQIQFRAIMKQDRPRKTIFETTHGKNEIACSALAGLRRAKEIRDHLHVKNRLNEGTKDDFLSSKCRSRLDLPKATPNPTTETESLSNYRVPNLNGPDIRETGLSLQNSGFAAEAREAVLELQNDEMISDTRPVGAKQRMTWDRKRKRFVGEKTDERTKKIRTESGAVISASYKTGVYDKWLKSSNAGMVAAKTVSFEDDDNEGGNKLHGQNKNKWSKKSKPNAKSFQLLNNIGRKNKFGNNQKLHSSTVGVSQKGRELKPEQVMKKMREKQKVKDFQKKRQMINKKKKSNKK